MTDITAHPGIADSIAELVGRTPMVRLSRVLLLVQALAAVCWAAGENRILPGVSVGPIRADCRPATLAKLGIRPEDIFEGSVGAAPDDRPATELWAMDRTRRLSLVWSRARPEVLVKVVLFGERSIWATPEGISLGTDRATLQRLNGRPFRLRSFEGERSGEVVDWQSGQLQAYRSGLTLALSLKVPGYNTLTGEEKEALERPDELQSDEPLLEKLEPVVERLEVHLNPE